MALQELYRVANQYFILMESAYELSDEEAQARMKKHGYITELYKTAVELGYDIVEYSLYGMCTNPLNPTGFLVIKKEYKNDIKSSFCCPITRTSLKFINGAYYLHKSLLVYPVLDGIPCLTKENAIVATKFGLKN